MIIPWSFQNDVFGPSLLKLQVIIYKYSSLLFLREFLEVLFTPSSPKSVAYSPGDGPGDEFVDIVDSPFGAEHAESAAEMTDLDLGSLESVDDDLFFSMLLYNANYKHIFFCALFVAIFCNLYPLSSIFNIFFFARGLIMLMAQILQQLVGGLSSFIKFKTRF